MTEFDPVAWWADAQVRARLLPGGAAPRIGRYEVLRSLGHGGTGVVFEARDRDLNRRVALKVLRAVEAAPKLRARIRKEARAIASVSHPGIVTVLSVDEFRDSLVVVMELIEGPPLSRWLAERRRVSEILARFIEAGEGIAAAHAAGVVHGDFKPDNVLLDADGHAKVVDFGLSAVVGSTLDGHSSDYLLSGGTEYAMSPEQRRGDRVDARSDQYSFCVALRDALANAEGAVPRRVDRALRRGLAHEPEDRFARLELLLDALRTPSWPRTRWGAAAGALALAAVGYASCPPPRDCEPSTLWPGDHRDRIKAALPDASPATDRAWVRFDDTLTDFDERWRESYRQACETRDAHDAPLRCLGRQRAEATALLSALDQGRTATFFAKARQPTLGDPEHCLRAADDALPPETEAIVAEATRLVGLLAVPAPEEVEEPAEALLARAEADGHPVGLMHARLVLGRVSMHGTRDSRRGAELLRAAFDDATELDAPVVAYRAAHGLISHYMDRDADETARWIAFARAAAAQLEGRFQQEALLVVSTLEAVHLRYREPEAALAAAAEARRRCTELHADEDMACAQAAATLAATLHHLERYQEAEIAARRALEIGESVMPGTLDVELHRVTHAMLLRMLGRDDEALAAFELALANALEAGSASHRLYPYFVLHHASALLATDRRQEGIERLAASLDALVTADDPDAETLAETARILAFIATGEQRYRDAIRFARMAHDALEKHGDDHVHLTRIRLRLGDLHARIGRVDEARAWLERVDAAGLAGDPNSVLMLVARARIAKAEGRREDALTLLDEAATAATRFSGSVTQDQVDRLRAELHEADDAVATMQP